VREIRIKTSYKGVVIFLFFVKLKVEQKLAGDLVVFLRKICLKSTQFNEYLVILLYLKPIA